MEKPVIDIRSLQKPLKEQYRRDPQSSRITLAANGSETSSPLSCSVDIGRAIYQAEAHKGLAGLALLHVLATCCSVPWPLARSLHVNWSHQLWGFQPCMLE